MMIEIQTETSKFNITSQRLAEQARMIFKKLVFLILEIYGHVSSEAYE